MKERDMVQDISVVFYQDELFRKSDNFRTPVTITLQREAPFGVKDGVILTGKDVTMHAEKASTLLQDSVMIEADTVKHVQLIPALDEKTTESFISGTATVYLRNEGTHLALVTEQDTDGRYNRFSKLQPICATQLTRDSQGKITALYSGLACVNSHGHVIQTHEYSDPNNEVFRAQAGEEKGSRVYSALYGDIFLDSAAYRLFRSEHGEGTYPTPEYMLGCYYTIDITGRPPSFVQQHQKIYNSDLSTEADLNPQDCEQMICAVYQEKIIPDLQDQVEPEMQQIVRLGDLRYVCADELEGALVVRYEIISQDGHTEYFYEAYPLDSSTQK